MLFFLTTGMQQSWEGWGPEKWAILRNGLSQGENLTTLDRPSEEILVSQGKF